MSSGTAVSEGSDLHDFSLFYQTLNAGTDPGFSNRGDCANDCAHTLHNREGEAQSPLRPGSRLIWKHSDTKLD